MIQKEFSEISWLVTEPEYREDPALSYSNLKTYESSGFDGLSHLFDKKESPSLLLGSVVDTLLTGGENEFNQLFSVVNINVTPGGLDVINALIAQQLPYESFKDIPTEVVSETAKIAGFWEGEKWDKTRYDKVLKTGNVADCYNAMKNSSKRIVSTEMYNDALAMVNALRTTESTRAYFAPDNTESNIRRYYQLKFKFSHDGVDYRSMADLICVDYKRKIVYPIDLKTSSEFEWNFENTFLKWGYAIQARLYWRNIRDNMDRDEYFKDFKLEDFRFIVVNKLTLTPLVWEFPLTKEEGSLTDIRGNLYRDPYDLGKELAEYLKDAPTVPNGITKTGINTLGCLSRFNS